MSIREDLNEALKTAMREQNRRRLCTIRLIQAAIKDRDIAARTSGQDGVSADTIQEILAKMVRQREESIKMYLDAGRTDLAESEQQELEIISGFMLPQLSAEETEKAVDAAIREAEANSLRDVGRTMGVLKEAYAGRMDFAKACTLVKERLSASIKTQTA